MLNKRGYSYGAAFHFHVEQVGASEDSWSVFDARTDEVKGSGLKRHEAFSLCERLNGTSASPSQEVLDEMDAQE